MKMIIHLIAVELNTLAIHPAVLFYDPTFFITPILFASFSQRQALKKIRLRK